jgi:protein-L-isoaspartate(D-aspartate) O-methyltransferase
MDSQAARARMVEAQIAGRGVRDPRVLAAMRAVPREVFISPGFEEFAYEDSALPIAEGQSISQPYIVAAMLEAADIDKQDRVLEIGAGSGYAAAVLSRLAQYVFAIERYASLADAAGERLRALGYSNVAFRTGDGTQGWPEEAPFDAIIVSAGGPSIPEELKRQLAAGGRLIMPVGEPDGQRLKRLVKTAEAQFLEDDLGAVSFVRLVGAEGTVGVPDTVPSDL